MKTKCLSEKLLRKCSRKEKSKLKTKKTFMLTLKLSLSKGACDKESKFPIKSTRNQMSTCSLRLIKKLSKKLIPRN